MVLKPLLRKVILICVLRNFRGSFGISSSYIFEYCAAIKKNQTQILIQTICNLFLRKFQNSRETNCKSLVQIRGGAGGLISTLPPQIFRPSPPTSTLSCFVFWTIIYIKFCQLQKKHNNIFIWCFALNF